MSLPTRIEYRGVSAKVTKNGELVVGTLEYSAPYYKRLDVDNQIYNVVPLKAGKRFITVGMLIAASRAVSTDTSIHIYESTSSEGTTSLDILKVDLNKGEHTYLNLINLVTSGAVWINATCDDDDVDLTIFGYYVDL